MAIVIGSNYGPQIDGLFDTSDARYIRRPNAYLHTGSLYLSASSATLEVVDSKGTQIHFLTPGTTPAITVEPPNYLHVVERIDITGAPEGDIRLYWTLTNNGTDYVLSQSVSYAPAVPAIFVKGATQTLQDYNVVLSSPKTFTVKVTDQLSNPYDGVNAKLVVQDNTTNSEVLRLTGSLLGNGLWTVEHTFGTSDLQPSKNRYEVYWEVDLPTGGTFEVFGSRQSINVTSTPAFLQAGQITYCTNQDLRTHIQGIDLLLNKSALHTGDIEQDLNAKRYQAAAKISRALAYREINAPDLLRTWEIHEVWHAVLLDSMAGAKQAANSQLLKEIQTEIWRIKTYIFGPVNSLRIQKG